MQSLNEGGTAQWSSGNSSDTADIISNFELLKSRFLSQGIPVIIGEFGAVNRENEDARADWVGFYLRTANQYNVPCIWWDNNLFSGSGELFGLLDRGSCQIRYPKIMQAINDATKDRG
jgi:endoglucanase